MRSFLLSAVLAAWLGTADDWQPEARRVGARGLDEHELGAARLVFGDAPWLDAVRIVPESLLTTLSPDHAITLFGTIHAGERFQTVTLIHELTHVWQAYRLGPRYLSDSLLAQLGAGSGYGGEETLVSWRLAGASIDSFNVEQQGDILADYYRRRLLDLDVGAWQPYVDDVRAGRAPD